MDASSFIKLVWCTQLLRGVFTLSFVREQWPRDLEQDVFCVGLQFHTRTFAIEFYKYTTCTQPAVRGPFILSWAIHISGTRSCHLVNTVMTVSEPGNGPDTNLSLQTETTETKRLSLHCKIPPSADSPKTRGTPWEKEWAAPPFLAWGLPSMPTLSHPPCQSQQPCPPHHACLQLAVTLDLRVSCDRYFCCLCVCVF